MRLDVYEEVAVALLDGARGSSFKGDYEPNSVGNIGRGVAVRIGVVVGTANLCALSGGLGPDSVHYMRGEKVYLGAYGEYRNPMK